MKGNESDSATLSAYAITVGLPPILGSHSTNRYLPES